VQKLRQRRRLVGDEIDLRAANAGGGLMGREIRLLTRDDAGKPEQALRAANDLVLNELKENGCPSVWDDGEAAPKDSGTKK
jgi:Periplasmic binding protein